MDIIKFVTGVLAMTICVTTGQQLYSSFLHVLPTGIPDQVIYFLSVSEAVDITDLLSREFTENLKTVKDTNSKTCSRTYANFQSSQ